MKRLLALSLAALLLAPLARADIAPPQVAAKEEPAKKDDAPIARAADGSIDVKAIWSKKCAGCHNENGDGQTKMGIKHKVDDLTDAKWQAKKTDEKFKDSIANGVPDTKMKAYKDKLSADEIDALVKHVRAFAKKG